MLTAMGFIRINEIYCTILDWTHYPYSIRFEADNSGFNFCTPVSGALLQAVYRQVWEIRKIRW